MTRWWGKEKSPERGKEEGKGVGEDGSVRDCDTSGIQLRLQLVEDICCRDWVAGHGQLKTEAPDGHPPLDLYSLRGAVSLHGPVSIGRDLHVLDLPMTTAVRYLTARQLQSSQTRLSGDTRAKGEQARGSGEEFG